MRLTFETEQDEDGRWIAETPEIPGAMACGATKPEAIARAEARAEQEQVALGRTDLEFISGGACVTPGLMEKLAEDFA